MSKSHFITIGLIISFVALGFAFQWSIVTQGWPFLIFLLCPLMHIFMGHNHGEHDHGGGEGHKKHRHSHNNEEDHKGGSHH